MSLYDAQLREVRDRCNNLRLGAPRKPHAIGNSFEDIPDDAQQHVADYFSARELALMAATSSKYNTPEVRSTIANRFDALLQWITSKCQPGPIQWKFRGTLSNANLYFGFELRINSHEVQLSLQPHADDEIVWQYAAVNGADSDAVTRNAIATALKTAVGTPANNELIIVFTCDSATAPQRLRIAANIVFMLNKYQITELYYMQGLFAANAPDMELDQSVLHALGNDYDVSATPAPAMRERMQRAQQEALTRSALQPNVVAVLQQHMTSRDLAKMRGVSKQFDTASAAALIDSDYNTLYQWLTTRIAASPHTRTHIFEAAHCNISRSAKLGVRVHDRIAEGHKYVEFTLIDEFQGRPAANWHESVGYIEVEPPFDDNQLRTTLRAVITQIVDAARVSRQGQLFIGMPPTTTLEDQIHVAANLMIVLNMYRPWPWVQTSVHASYQNRAMYKLPSHVMRNIGSDSGMIMLATQGPMQDAVQYVHDKWNHKKKPATGARKAPSPPPMPPAQMLHAGKSQV